MRDTYDVREGKIHTLALGINVAEHCNLSCRSCSHLSPVLARRFVEPTTLQRDLGLLARVYAPGFVRFLGGEPLLHPNLLELVAAVRASGIASTIVVATNGTLLPRMPEACWRAVDVVTVSVYPGRALGPEQMSHCTLMADRHGVQLAFQYFERFREQFAAREAGDPVLVQRIYDTCLIRHTWRAHTLADGYFYRCPPAYFQPRGLRSTDDLATWDAANGVRLSDAPGFRVELLAYLKAPEPLTACRRCLGAVGRMSPHQQVERRSWLDFVDRGVEELLDQEFLASLERDLRLAVNRGVRTALSGGITRVV
jgi:organic radical activating enzyme